MQKLVCINCGKKYEESVRYVCDCGGLLEVVYDFDSMRIDLEAVRSRPLGVWRYSDLLPTKKYVSLDEGGTPLYKAKRLGDAIGMRNIFIKNEGANPTGSFKDRGMTVGVSKAMEFGMKRVACASTGNTSASMAAYAARAGITAIVLLPKGKIAYGKLSQALIFGAKVITIPGNFDKAMEMVKDVCSKENIYLLNSLNPYRLEGQKTIGYEIIDQLSGSPDRIILPVGNAGNISAIWKGIKEYERLGAIDSLPAMCGIQAEGAKPIVEMFRNHASMLSKETNPETVATAIRIGNPVNWPKAIRAITDSGGLAESVTDEEILNAQKILARKEGIFVEPASAASIAGLIKLKEAGKIDGGERIVCITTGNGLKDPDTAINITKHEIIELKSPDGIGSVI